MVANAVARRFLEDAELVHGKLRSIDSALEDIADTLPDDSGECVSRLKNVHGYVESAADSV